MLLSAITADSFLLLAKKKKMIYNNQLYTMKCYKNITGVNDKKNKE